MHAGAPAGASAQMHEEDWCLAFAELPSTSHAATACAMHIDHLPLRSCHWQASHAQKECLIRLGQHRAGWLSTIFVTCTDFKAPLGAEEEQRSCFRCSGKKWQLVDLHYASKSKTTHGYYMRTHNLCDTSAPWKGGKFHWNS
eukprot:scaffold150979_cov20-Tisochrysis_lutea.AAC.1